jgi:4-diphosphocytidyl-2-C-methyl-D-erythritol kinase
VTSIREIARAKVNLTLRVLGRRPDGYHEIESLVAFADAGDRVTLTPRPHCRVRIGGPFARDIVGANLLARTLDVLSALDAGLTLGTVELEKNLPVAAGLGGGSADAAALLRAVRQANPDRADAVAWHEVAARLGADVPVCLAGVPAVMRGIGEMVEPLEGSPALPAMPAVLVNPGRPLATPEVFRALAAAPLGADERAPLAVSVPLDAGGLAALMRERGNDLEGPATALLPAIADIKAALSSQAGCLVAAMSGSGPTCFGLFADTAAAARATATLAHYDPRWWVVETRLGA